jgi:hypothetical protein
MLWAALVVSRLERAHALGVFRRVAELIHDLPEEQRFHDVTLTGMATLSQDIQLAVYTQIIETAGHSTIMRPLLLLEELPGRDEWMRAVGEDPEPQDWLSLMKGVALTLDHQSQEATDCRWMRVLGVLFAKKLKLGSEQQVREMLEYPDFGDMRAVRPSIRAAEGGLDTLSPRGPKWAEAFWAQCLRDTDCLSIDTDGESVIPLAGTTPARVDEVVNGLLGHWSESVSSSAIDGKHDASFGFALYSLSILRELMRIGASSSILARQGLRTMVRVSLLSLISHKQTVRISGGHIEASGWGRLSSPS